MSNWVAWLGIVTPLLVVLGLIWAFLRWSHRTAHHWQKVWTLPDVVDNLAKSVDHHTTEMAELKDTIRERLPPPGRRGGQPWPPGGR